jgi:hypothetical protein
MERKKSWKPFIASVSAAWVPLGLPYEGKRAGKDND